MHPDLLSSTSESLSSSTPKLIASVSLSSWLHWNNTERNQINSGFRNNHRSMNSNRSVSYLLLLPRLMLLFFVSRWSRLDSVALSGSTRSSLSPNSPPPSLTWTLRRRRILCTKDCSIRLRNAECSSSVQTPPTFFTSMSILDSVSLAN